MNENKSYVVDKNKTKEFLQFLKKEKENNKKHKEQCKMK